MSQNINLFPPALRREKRALTLNSLTLTVLVAVVVLGATHAYLRHAVAGLAEEVRSAEGLLNVQRRYVEKLQGEFASRKPDPALEVESARLESELKVARETMAALEGGVLGSKDGFAEYLRALARQSAQGLWLTGLSIGSGELEIRGRVLSPDLMPVYIKRLHGEKILAGRNFDHLRISQPRQEKAERPAGDGGREGAAAGVPAPRYLEFSLATMAAAAPEKAQ